MIRPITQSSRELAELVRFLGIESSHQLIMNGISSDSKAVEIGDLFVAVPGAKVHGASFINEIAASGAVAILTDEVGAELIADKLPTIVIKNPREVLGQICSWFYDSPSRSLKIAGITGTNGKTTTTQLLNQILKFAGKETGLIGTIGIEIGSEKISANFTTPEASNLQALFATMQERHVSHVSMEVSSHAISRHRVAGSKFSFVGFTNLSQDHLDFHGDMATYFAVKSQLFAMEFSELGFINIDDEYGAKLADTCKIPVIKVSRSNQKAQWRFERIESQPRGYDVAIRGTGGALIEGEINLVGEHNLDNVLMAVAMAYEFEIDPLVIADILAKLIAAPGRLEPVEIGQKFSALVDFAHTPDAVKKTLETLRNITSGKLIAVLGCGGDRDISKRAEMGAQLLSGSDQAIFTSDNPRSEDPSKILEDMTANLKLKENSSLILDRREAIALAVASALPGDCLVVLGKGHETGQEVQGVLHPFDDRIELARAIEELS